MAVKWSELLDELNTLANHYAKMKETWRLRSYKKAVQQLKSFLTLPESKNLLKDILPRIPKFSTRDDFVEFRGGSEAKEWTPEFKKLVNEVEKNFKSNDVKGFGKGIVSKTIEWLSTGKIKKVEQVEEEVKEFKKKKTKKEQIIESFMWNSEPSGIWNVGPVAAAELYEKGFRDIDKIDPSVLSDTQQVGLKYYKELREPIPHDYIKVFGDVMRYVLDTEFGKGSYKMKISGSYRRGKKTSGDIDCLMTSEKFTLPEAIDAFMKWKIVTDILSIRYEKFMGIAHCPSESKGHFRLDIEFVPKEEWYSALLYFTGSKSFNIDMRLHANKNNYHLDQHGIFKKITESQEKKLIKKHDLTKVNDKNKKKARSYGYTLTKDGLFKVILPINSEKDIFDELELRYVTPSNR